MKKRILSIILILICLLFCGCKTNDLQKVSKNLTSYQIIASYDENKHELTATQTVDYINNEDTSLNFLCFHLHANTFREDAINKPVSLMNEHKAYPNGKSYGGINILSVNDMKDASFTHSIEGEDQNILKVDLKEELFPNERVKIKIQYIVILANVNHRLGYGENTINFGNFYPIVCVYENGDFFTKNYNKNGDPFYSEVANYVFEIKYNNEFTIAHTGIGETKSVDEFNITKASAQVVRDFVFVLSNKFSLLSTEYNNIKINYFYYDDSTPEKSLETSKLAMETFSQKFGAYPYSVVNVVQANFVHGGMEYPNLVLISDEIIDNDTYLNVIVHELAHQWWYGLVGNNQYDYGWLDEGLTEFSTALFYEINTNYNLKYDVIMSNAMKSYTTFHKVYTDVFGSVNTDMKRCLNEFETEPEYVYISYVKSMLMFNSLREVIGDKSFYKALQSLYKNYSFKVVSPEILINAFETSTCKNLEGFFMSWLDGKIVVECVE